MRTKQAFDREFPNYNKNQLEMGYQFLEVIHPDSAEEPDYRLMVMESLDESGNLLCLRVKVPLEWT